MSTSDYTKSVIAAACYRSAPKDLHQVMLSVCMVFMNRAAAGWFEGSVYLNASKYLEELPWETVDERDPQFQQLLSKLDTVLSGMAQDKTGGALWFGPKSEDLTLPEESKITTTIGSLVFVR